jgi:hypothetical protein
METTVGKVLSLLVSMAVAAVTASMLVHRAFDCGLSREEIRAFGVIAAIFIGALLAIEQFGKRLRRPK